MRLFNLFLFKKKTHNSYETQKINFMNSQCSIVFTNETKAQHHFINSVWSKVYCQYTNLDEMKIHLHSQINRQLATALNQIDIAGFKPFFKTGDSWISEHTKYGKIHINLHKKQAVA